MASSRWEGSTFPQPALASANAKTARRRGVTRMPSPHAIVAHAERVPRRGVHFGRLNAQRRQARVDFDGALLKQGKQQVLDTDIVVVVGV
jgi:hypothetical protein